MEGKTCCVTGHRDIPQKEINKVKAALRREVDLAVKEGFTRFMSGFAEGVDQYFAEIVLEKKKKNPALELIAVIPYQKRLDNLMEKRRTYEMLEACADVVVMQEKYHPSVYSHRNRYMAEHSDRVIAVYDGREKGGTVRTIRFAHQMKKEFREGAFEVFPAGTVAHYTLDKGTISYSVGLGYRFTPNFYMDLACVYRQYKEDAYTFSKVIIEDNNGLHTLVDSEAIGLKTNTTQVALTLGYKF